MLGFVGVGGDGTLSPVNVLKGERKRSYSPTEC